MKVKNRKDRQFEFLMTSCETKFNATDYIRVDSRTMHGQEKFDEAVSAGQLIISYQILCQLKTVRIINIVIIIIVVVPFKNHFL